MPTLAELVTALPGDLTPVGEPALDASVSAVHVSELIDPTPYLDGGELLLTTGLALTGPLTQARAYTARLAGHGLTGLALGLGPVHTDVPDALVSSCAAAGLPLLVVPAPTPFLSISRAYWGLVQRADRAALTTALGAHRDLAHAATTRDPVGAVVRVLAGAVGGWAARLGPDGRPLKVWPRGEQMTVRRLSREVERLRTVGPHASATFPVGADDVVVHPLTRGARLVGFVAVGAPRPMDPTARGLVLSACALLSAVLDESLARALTGRERRACVVELVTGGQPVAARVLATRERTGLPRHVVLLVVVPPTGWSAADLLTELEAALPSANLWATSAGDQVHLLLTEESVPAVIQVLDGLRSGERALRWAASPGTPLEGVPAVLAPTSQAARRGRESGHVDGADLVARLTAHARVPLVPTVVAYLRHRGHWEQTAAATGTHRNTVRARIATATRVLGVDLDDPDVSAGLWLALRAAGLA